MHAQQPGRALLPKFLIVQDIVPKYLALMRELGFNATTPLYVASALLTYDDSAGGLQHAHSSCSGTAAPLDVSQVPESRMLCLCAAGFGRMATLLQKEGLCSRAVAKEHLLPAADLAGGLSG